jgi:acyl carrier protein
MTEKTIRAAYLEELTRVAPDITAEDVTPDAHIQEDLELDSMDILNFVSALHDRLGIDIPETDYPRIATLSDAVPYLMERLSEAGQPQ